MVYVSLRDAVKKLGLHENTLRKYADEGTIPSIRMPSGQRKFDIDAFLKLNGKSSTICYCRVSSSKQSDDLERQIKKVQEIFQEAEIIKDIGSGLNFKRKGLRAILERLLRGDKLKIVVTHKDRLARFGFEIIKFLVEQNGGEILVLDGYVAISREAELTADLLAILHHFSCRMHGQRSKKSLQNQNISDDRAKKDIPSMVQCFKESLQRDYRNIQA